MLRITSMRGAQSAGLVTYGATGGLRIGLRHRVVNGKRTDLTNKIIRKCRSMLLPRAIRDGQFFQGHTRFATSSIAELPGCHPHQWTKAKVQHVWSIEDGKWVGASRNVEAFITHNGDFDALSLQGTIYSTDEVSTLLVALLHSPAPATVDSMCVAGMLELLRTKGMWAASVRYGYLFGALAHHATVNLAVLADRGELWNANTLKTVATAFEMAWTTLLQRKTAASSSETQASSSSSSSVSTFPPIDDEASPAISPSGSPAAPPLREAVAGMRSEMKTIVAAELMATEKLGLQICNDETAACTALIESAVDAFFDQGLLAAAQQLLAQSMGSFGLVLSHSLDADGELVIAARGQTMSLAFYPKHSMVMFGSESAATKAGMTDAGMTLPDDEESSWLDASFSGRLPHILLSVGEGGRSSPDSVGRSSPSLETSTRGGTPPNRRPGKAPEVLPAEFRQNMKGSTRLDLDDVNGEVVQLQWGSQTEMTRKLQQSDASKTHELMRYTDSRGVASSLLVWNAIGDAIQSVKKQVPRRLLPLEGNPLVQELPPYRISDPVGADIKDIPSVLRNIKEDWNEPETSLNRMSAYHLSTLLRRRMRLREDGDHAGSLDVLITGCEVSLWLGEQFAADLHLAFPKLSIECVSANKLLGLLGQSLPIPQLGFRFHPKSHKFHNAVVIMISHSGGTFATLNCAKLLKAFTRHQFIVTSEWDTQVARAVREPAPGQRDKLRVGSYVFTTFCGSRPAEPCSLTVAATQQVLTNILFYLMYSIGVYEKEHPNLGGVEFAQKDVQELESLNLDSLATIDAVVEGSSDAAASRVRAELIAQGTRWAQHVLEAPISWILSAIYILATVTVGATPLSAIVDAVANAIIESSAATSQTELAAASDFATALAGLDCADAAAMEACTDAARAYSAAVAPTERPVYAYVIGAVDAVIYAFLPWWTTILLRIWQRRPVLHRVAGRSVLIGDIPWVAQSVEAFASKLFALSYSIATCSFASGNPSDHLVHRHTHRVVRGSLLCVGRPDGRLNALTSAENAVCLSVNQASSIQNYGVTCESITIGHNPYKLPLSANAIFIPRLRQLFFSEVAVEGLPSPKKPRKTLARGKSAANLVGTLNSLKTDATDADDNGIHDVFDELIEERRQDASARSQDNQREAPSEDRRSSDPEKRVAAIPPLRGEFLGAWMADSAQHRGLNSDELMRRQELIQSLYETRIASLHRFVSFVVMFHAMGKAVARFWPRATLGMFRYDISRTHSIMRIATTASPVSGAEVREMTIELANKTIEESARSVFQLFAASWYTSGYGKSGSTRNDEWKLDRMLNILHIQGGTRYRKQASKNRRNSKQPKEAVDSLRPSVLSLADVGVGAKVDAGHG